MERAPSGLLTARLTDTALTFGKRVEYRGGGALLGRRLVVLVHGYWNTQASASKSFRNFSAHLRDCARDVDGKVVEYHWPSNPRKWPDDPTGISRLLPPSFIKSEDNARRAGEMLADYLASLPGQPRVVVVGHSLGCLVALEMSRDLRNAAPRLSPRVESLVLLAAAVPNRLCRKSSRVHYGPTLVGCDDHVFYSPLDPALIGFRLSRSGRREGGAVGSFGRPRNRWSTRRNMHFKNHSSYWPSEEVASDVAQILGARPPTGPRIWVPERREVSRTERVERNLPSR